MSLFMPIKEQGNLVQAENGNLLDSSAATSNANLLDSSAATSKSLGQHLRRHGKTCPCFPFSSFLPSLPPSLPHHSRVADKALFHLHRFRNNLQDTLPALEEEKREGKRREGGKGRKECFRIVKA